MLKKKIARLEDVEEDFRELYVKQEDGTFSLELEDDDKGKDKQKVEEFRNNNRKLLKENQDMRDKLEKFGNIDPDSLAAGTDALAKIKKLEEDGLLKDGKIDEVLKRRTETMKADFDKQLGELRKENQKLTQQKQLYQEKLATTLIDAEIGTQISAVGVPKKGASDDIRNRARQAFKVNDAGEIEANGVFDEEGNPITPEKWAKRLLQEADHLFLPSEGSGSKGGRKGDQNQPNTISAEDPAAFSKNLAEIASGKVQVVQSGR